MTVDRQYGRIIIHCDTCDEETFEGKPGEQFQAVWERAKEAGWKVRKIGSEFVHGCPTDGV